jgi:hypothetical protein
MAWVFLSYAKEDAETADFLYSELRQRGVNVWKDDKSLRVGEHFKEAIEKAIRTCDLAIACLSSTSVNKTGYVQNEFRQIVDMQRYRPTGVPFVLPVKLDSCETPPQFADYHWKQMPPTKRETFIDELVEDINEHSRTIAKYKRSFDHKAASTGFPESFDMTGDVLCRVIDHPAAFVIRVNVQLKLQDYGSYKLAGTPDLSSWSRDTLDTVVRDVMFGAQYVDVVFDFDGLRDEILRVLLSEAEKIGYQMRTVIVPPEFEPYDWLKTFTLEIEERFQTRSPDVSVGMKIMVTVRIASLRDIEPYILRQQDVPSLMREAIIRQVNSVIHLLDAKRVYVDFEFSDLSNELPVRQVLEEGIRARLTEQFHAEVSDINFKFWTTN